MSNMPIFPVDAMVADLTPDEEKLVRAAFIRKTGKLRTTKPFRRTGNGCPCNGCAEFEGSANYVWRMLCFDYVSSPPHSCMPITADFDIPGDCRERREKSKVLDELIRHVESVLPALMMAGAMRWKGLV